MQDNFQLNTNLKIEKIIIENNSIKFKIQYRKKSLSQLYETNLFILNKKISDELKN